MPKSDKSRENSTSELASNIDRAVHELGDEVESYLNEMIKKAKRPDVLLHFTDSAGLMGILRSQTLWASLATALNDASETTVALDLMAFAGPMAIARSRYLHYEFLESVFKGDLPIQTDDLPTDYRTYVTSLCAEDVAVHWMQYARAGTGVALELDANKLANLPQFRLCKVIYDTNQQFAYIRSLIEIIDKFLDRSLANAGSTENAEVIKIAAARMLHSFIKMAAPQMKDIAFSAEDEWRLFSIEAWAKPEKVTEQTRPTKFRSTANRIVPYKEVPIPADSIKEIKLGFSCSLRNDEQALRVLMDECISRQVPISRSLIAVRP